MWRSNTKASVTKQFCVEWVHGFVSTVKEYLQDKKLPLKCLLVLENAPNYFPGFENDLVDEFNFICVKYLSLNSTPLIQPIDQQITAKFTKLYTKALFRKCFQVGKDTQFTLKELWKNHFIIRNCVNVIDNNARSQVSYKNINSAWRKFWPGCVPERDFERFETDAPAADVDENAIAEEISSLGRSMG